VACLPKGISTVPFNIVDSRDLLVQLADADTLSSYIEAPTQRIHLRQLGHLALLLGFESGFIDPMNQDVYAHSAHGTIRTDEIQMLGKIIRFAGDIWTFLSFHSRSSATSLYRPSCAIAGILC
jgi:hypothetical protein